MVGLRIISRFTAISLFAAVSALSSASVAQIIHNPTAHAPPPKAKPSVAKPSKPAVIAKPASAKSAPSAKADVLFEGYSKILLGTTHIGYTIQRFEFNAKTKEYSTTYYLKTQAPANDVIESLKARSTYDLQPLSYQYTELAGGKVHIVDATFNNGVMNVSSLQNGKRQALAPKKIMPGTFLASFLGYLMLQAKDGVKVGNKYNYQAIAEEDGNIYKGEAYIKSQEPIKGVMSYKILNTYKDVKFISYFTAKGEVLATNSDAQGISTELVANIQEATKGMSVNLNQLNQLFGAVPQGQENAVAKHSAGEPLGSGAAPAKSKAEILEGEPSKNPATKQEGVPGGQGIIIKGSPEKTNDPGSSDQ